MAARKMPARLADAPSDEWELMRLRLALQENARAMKPVIDELSNAVGKSPAVAGVYFSRAVKLLDKATTTLHCECLAGVRRQYGDAGVAAVEKMTAARPPRRKR